MHLPIESAVSIFIIAFTLRVTISPLLLYNTPVRIGFTQTTQTVSEADSGVPITLRVLEGVIAPELGNLQVTVSTADVTATGQRYYTDCLFLLELAL